MVTCLNLPLLSQQTMKKGKGKEEKIEYTSLPQILRSVKSKKLFLRGLPSVGMALRFRCPRLTIVDTRSYRHGRSWCVCKTNLNHPNGSWDRLFHSPRVQKCIVSGLLSALISLRSRLVPRWPDSRGWRFPDSNVSHPNFKEKRFILPTNNCREVSTMCIRAMDSTRGWMHPACL
jgi:hypothetical protein